MKKKNRYLILILIILSLACQNKIELNSEQIFISDNFLKIVDTTAYKTGAFVFLPTDTIKYPKLSVYLNSMVTYNKKIDELTHAYLEKDKNLKSSFKDLFEKGKYVEFSLDSNFPRQIGKYVIFFNEKNIDKNIKYAGRIDIQNFKMYKNEAIMVLSKSVERYGTTYILVLKKEKNIWKVVRKEILYQA